MNENEEGSSSPCGDPLASEVDATVRDTEMIQSENMAPARRGFLVKALASLVGLVVGAIPALTGLFVVTDPLRRAKGGAVPYVPVVPLDAVPADGKPRSFPVITDKKDAWTLYRDVPVGAVFLRREAEKPDEVTCFNVICPHLGCFVNPRDDDTFLCPCHDSVFHADGARGKPNVAQRGLDTLETKIDESGMILVQFQNFLSSEEKKIPVS